jgi:hypothetical protein
MSSQPNPDPTNAQDDLNLLAEYCQSDTPTQNWPPANFPQTYPDVWNRLKLYDNDAIPPQCPYNSPSLDSDDVGLVHNALKYLKIAAKDADQEALDTASGYIDQLISS